MKNLGELLKQNPLFGENKKRGPNSKRAYWIQQICDDILTQKDFRKVMGQARFMTVGEIESIYLQAKSWRVNPPALFWKLLKEKNAEIKSTILNKK